MENNSKMRELLESERLAFAALSALRMSSNMDRDVYYWGYYAIEDVLSDCAYKEIGPEKRITFRI